MKHPYSITFNFLLFIVCHLALYLMTSSVLFNLT